MKSLGCGERSLPISARNETRVKVGGEVLYRGKKKVVVVL